MGTKAVFAVEIKPGFHCTTIIGMVMDGTPYNLKYIATLFESKMNKLRKKTAIKKGNTETIKQVLESITSEKDLNNWLFVDNVNNASWVSHSAIFSPKIGVLRIYDGLFESPTEKVMIRTPKLG